MKPPATASGPWPSATTLTADELATLKMTLAITFVSMARADDGVLLAQEALDHWEPRW